MYYRYVKDIFTNETLDPPAPWKRIKYSKASKDLYAYVRSGHIETKNESNTPAQARNRKLFILQGQIAGHIRMSYLLAEQVKSMYPNDGFYAMTTPEIVAKGDNLIKQERETANRNRQLLRPKTNRII